MSDSKSNDTKAEAKDVFDYYDSDKSGFIDEVELALVCSSLGENLDKSKLQAVFKVLDASNNGKIAFEDFYKWWSTESGSSGNVISSMRAKLLLSKGLKYLAASFNKKQDEAKAADKPLTFALHGAVTDSKMGLTVSIDKKDTILSSTEIAFALTLTLTKAENAAWVVDVLNTGLDMFEAATKDSYSKFPFVMKAVDSKDGTIRFIGEMRAGNQSPPAEVGSILAAMDGFHGGFSLGWSWESLIKNQLTMRSLDLVNLEVFASVDKIPMFDMFAQGGIQQLEAMLEEGRSKIPFQNGVDGLDALKGGDLSARLDTTKLVDELFAFGSAQAPFPIDNLVDVTKAVLQMTGQQQQQAPATFSLACAKLIKSVFTRDISGLDSFELRVAGGQGVKVDFLNLLHLGNFFDACISFNTMMVSKELTGESN